MTDTPDLRSKLDTALDEIESEFIRDYIADIFSMTNLKWAEFEMDCPNCKQHLRKKVQVEKPDYKGVAAALALLADQGKGKPKESKVDPADDDSRIEAAVGRVLERLLTDPEKLERIAGS